jgi:hypothetical protein
MKRIFISVLMLCIMLSGCKAMDMPAEESEESLMSITENDVSNTATSESNGGSLSDEKLVMSDEESIVATVYEYFSCRHEIRANVSSEPFDTQSVAVLNLLGCCAGDEFINETLITRQMEYEQKQIIGERRKMDMSYQNYEFDTEYKTVDVDGETAKVVVKDEITFRLVADPEMESVAGDWHELQLEKKNGEWKITGDECDVAGYYVQQYRAYKADCDLKDIQSINEYVLEQFRNEVTAGLDAAGF